MIPLARWRDTGAEYRHRAHRIFYQEERAERPWLLLIHGFPTASWDWHRIWAGLRKHYSLIAPDLIGFGFSAKPRDYDYTIVDQADLAEGLLAARGIGTCRILAHDYGDSVAQELLARKIDGTAGFDFDAVCFLNGGLIPGAHRPRPVQKLLASPAGGLIGRLIGERAFKRSFRRILARYLDESELDDLWRLVSHDNGTRVAHRIIRYMDERKRHYERWVGALRDSPVPLCLIDGLLDPVSGGHLVEAFREQAPQAKVVELPDVGHYPQLEAPEETLAKILDFFDSASREPVEAAGS